MAKQNKIKAKSNPASYIMMGPWLILFFVFTVLPVVASIILSFTSFNMLQLPSFNGASNYIRLFLDDDIFLIALKNTLIFALLTGPAGYILGFVVAWGINEFNPRLRSLLTLAFYAPTLAGGAVYVIWLFIFSGDAYGLINSQLLNAGMITAPIQFLTDPKYTMAMCIIVIMWMSMGAQFLTFRAGLQSQDREIYEAGAIDGIRNRWQELWYLTLPQMRPQLLLGAVFTIQGSFSVGGVNAALTGNPSTDYSTHTIVLHIGDYAFTRFEMGYASAVSVVLFGMMLLFYFVVNKALAAWSTD